MAVFRIEKTKDYTVMSNFHLRDRDLTLKAKGLISLMLSLPESWDYTLSGLSCICNDGVDSVRSGVTELEKHGYLIRRRIRKANGQLGEIEYTILEQPRANGSNQTVPVDNSPPMRDKPMYEKPMWENPTQALPTYGKQAQSITNPTNTHELNIHGSTINLSIRSEPPNAERKNGMDSMDAMDVYRNIISENIGYEYLCQQYKFSIDIIDEILELMLETVCTTKKTIRIGGEDKPSEVVKSRMLKIDQNHIEYVLEALGKNTTEVRNIRSYLLTTIYNAPATIGNYYKALVNHDMYGDK